MKHLNVRSVMKDRHFSVPTGEERYSLHKPLNKPILIAREACMGVIYPQA